MKYRVQDDSVTRPGKGSPKYSGKSVTRRGESLRNEKGAEPGRYDIGREEHPEREGSRSTARDVSSVRPLDPISSKMPNLR